MDQSGVKVTLCDRKTLEELPEGMDGAFVDIEKAVEEGDFGSRNRLQAEAERMYALFCLLPALPASLKAL